MTTECTRTAPTQIWLTIFSETEDEPFPEYHEDITWSEGEVGDNDVRYTRADVADAEIARLKAHVAEMADALTETLSATSEPMPQYESGIEAQIRWVDRIAAARKAGHAALAKVGRHA